MRILDGATESHRVRYEKGEILTRDIEIREGRDDESVPSNTVVNCG